MPSNFGPYQPYTGFNTAYQTNTLWTCGQNNYGQLGNGTVVYYSSPIQIGSLTNWTQVSCGYFQASAIKTDGTLWTWGGNLSGQLGNGTTANYSSPIQVGSLTNWSKVACAGDSISAIKTDGTLWTCGYNNNGQLGNGTTVSYSSPIQVGSLTNWNQVAFGTYFTAAIKTDGTLWTWGSNGGQLGNGTTVSYSSPIQVGSLTNWKQVAGGSSHTAAIKTDGTLWTWGFNVSGQLGNGTNGINYYSPIQVGTLTTWKQVQCGFLHTAAIKTDGTLWTWGDDSYGQLGNGTTINYSSPIQVGSLTTWNQVATGSSYYILAIQTYNYNQDLGQRYTSKSYLLDVYPNIASQIGARTSPGLFTWGYDGYGQLGNGTILNYSSPIQVGSLTNWKQVAVGLRHTAAIKTDGTLWTCGYNNYGQLGANIQYGLFNSYTFVEVGTLTNWKQVTAGQYHTAAIKTDRTLWTWGSGTSGQLGNGTTNNFYFYSSPIQVGALTNWKQVSCGQTHTTAISSPDLP